MTMETLGATNLKDLVPLPPEGVTVVIPTRNEAQTLGAMLERTARALEGLDVPAEIVVVDDASPDGTADVAEAAVLPVPVRVIRRRARPSLSWSVVEGAREARYSTVAVLDADLSHDPEDIHRVLEPVLSGRADLALGSRYVPGGSVSEWPRRRRLLSRLGARLAQAVTRVRDPLSGFFAAKRDLLDGSTVRLQPRGYKILLEVLARAPGIRIEEVPIRFKDRAAGESKFGLRAQVEFLTQLFLLLLTRAGLANQARVDHPGERRREAVVRSLKIGSQSETQS
jgi:dolichol-phosphate mannosyltransferase